MATHSSVLAWRVPGSGEPTGCRLWDRTQSDTTEETQQQQQQQQQQQNTVKGAPAKQRQIDDSQLAFRSRRFEREN